MYNSLIKRAKEVLKLNDKQHYTFPSLSYPFQWAWDSAFIAIGYSTFNIERAYKELLSLFSFQQKDGFLPHMIYRESKNYFPSPSMWGVNSYPSFSRITQPPIFGLALERIVRRDKKPDMKVVKKLFNSIKKLHLYLLSKRDPEGIGLASIIHPWESGLDNSTRWDSILDNIRVEGVNYRRSDILNYGKEERPKKERYDAYMYLIKLMRKNKFELKKFYPSHPFKVKDAFFNSLLYLSNNSLIRIGSYIGEDISELEQISSQLKRSLLKFSKNSFAYDYDIFNEELIYSKSISTLSLLFSSISNPDFSGFLCSHLLASESLDSEKFNPINYWRGPVWININWFFYNSIINRDLKERVKRELISLTSRGFYEYYSSCSLSPLGAENFSWSASLLLDILSDF